MALMEVNFFSKALMRPVTMNVILPADKVFFEEETEEDDRSPNTLSRKLFFSKNIGELSSATFIFSRIIAEESPAI